MKRYWFGRGELIVGNPEWPSTGCEDEEEETGEYITDEDLEIEI